MARSRKMKLAHVEECFARLATVLPEPKTELSYRDPYTLLVAVVLSAQATDVGVNRATKGLYAAADTPQAMVDLGIDGIAHHIRHRPVQHQGEECSQAVGNAAGNAWWHRAG